MKRFFLALYYFFSCFLLTGCWSSIEVNERIFVSGLFVDLAPDNEVELTIASLLPNRMGSQSLQSAQSTEPPYAVITKKGPSLSIALKKIQKDLTRTISWGHTRIVVIGDRYARQGITPLLEWINRQPTLRLKTFVLVAPGKAKDIPTSTPIYEQSPPEVLREFANQNFILSTSIREVLMGYLGGQDTAITSLTFQKEKMVSEKGKKSPWIGNNGAAIFKKNRLVGKITPEQAEMFAWVKNTLVNPTMLIYHGKNRQKINLEFQQTKATIRPVLHHDQVVFRIQLKGVVSLLAADTQENLLNSKVLHQIRKEVQDSLRQRLLSGLRQTQHLESDALQLGSYLEWWHPKRWQQIKPYWRKYYREKVSFVIEPDIFIRHYGSEIQSIFTKSK